MSVPFSKRCVAKLAPGKKNPQGIACLDTESLIKTKKNARHEKDDIDILAFRKILKEMKDVED
jgi:hypothetical protein